MIWEFMPNGRFNAYAGGRYQGGRWWIEPNGLFCTQYRKVLSGKRFCSFARFEGNELKIFRPDGRPKGMSNFKFTTFEPPPSWVFVEGQPRCATPRLSFTLSGVVVDAAKQLKLDACHAMRKIEDWWGATFRGDMRVEVQEDNLFGDPLHAAWVGERGRIELGTGRVNTRQSVIFYRMVLVYTPNQNRFLATGLAVHAQQKLGEHPTVPNWGKDLHPLANRFIKDVALKQLDAIIAPSKLWIKGKLISLNAIIIAGSFVQFLIERFGMEKFKVLYALTPLRPGEKVGGGALERWQRVYGKSLDELEADWRRHIAATSRAVSAPGRHVNQPAAAKVKAPRGADQR